MTKDNKLFDLRATPKNTPSETRENEDWGKSVERKKPGRKKRKPKEQIHPRLDPEIVKELRDLAETREIDMGDLIMEIYSFWKDQQNISET